MNCGIYERQGEDAFDHFRNQLGYARPPRLVTQQVVEPLFHVGLLPAPDTGLGLAGLAHDRASPNAISRKQDDLSAKTCFWSIALGNHGAKTVAD